MTVRIAVVVNAAAAPAWARRAVAQLEAGAEAEVVALIDTGPLGRARSRPAGGFLAGFERRLIGSLQDGHGAFQEDVLAASIEPSLPAIADAAGLSLSDGDCERLQGLRPHLLISLVDDDLAPPLFSLAAGGVWDVVVGGYRSQRSAVAGHYEVLAGLPSTRVVLRRRTAPEDPGSMLYESHTSTEAMSVHLNASNAHWKAAAFFSRVLRQQPSIDATTATAMQPPIRVDVGRFAYLGLLGQKFRHKVERKAKEVFCNAQWTLGARRADELPRPGEERSFRRILPPPDRLWADPFLIRRDGKTWLFFENMRFATQRGEIAVAPLDDDGSLGPVETVLACDYHLSYPFLLEYGGELYMVPESYENARVDIYRCVEFPNKWRYEKTLLSDIRAADATLFEFDGRWWLFANVSEAPEISPWDELFAFYAESPLADTWRPHRLNPIVSDVRRARPAGAMIRHGGRMIRPAQDCGGFYGAGLNFCEVEELSPVAYRERVLCRLAPGGERGLVAMHTFNSAGGWQLTDFQRSIRRRR